MKSTRNIILSGLLAVTVLMIMSTNLVYAGEKIIGEVSTPDGPHVYLLKKDFAICGQYDTQMPSSGQQFGCLARPGDSEWYYNRVNEYAFTGERIAELVAVRDMQGAEAILKAELMVGDPGVSKVFCNDITSSLVPTDFVPNPESPTTVYWAPFGGDQINVGQELADMPPAYTAASTDGFNTETDKLYQCIFTVTSDMGYNPIMGSGLGGDELTPVYVEATDVAGETGTSQVQVWYFNPEIVVDVSVVGNSEITFDTGVPGQTVYSYDTLLISNIGGGGVDLLVWLAGQDLEAITEGAKCPDSNILDIRSMAFRCKVGTLFQNDWRDVPHWDDSQACPVYDGNSDCMTCQGALPIIDHFGLLANGHTAECWFRLTYPGPPCIGEFSNENSLLIFARAI